MAFSRRPNGSIIGANTTPTAVYPSVAYGIWDKNEQASLSSVTYWPMNVIPITYLVVAGGGGGAGYGQDVSGAGGGAGGVLSSIIGIPFSSIYTITIGSGGSGNYQNGRGTSGSDSSLIGGTLSITSKGGGGGGFYNDAQNGGSGGGTTGAYYPAGTLQTVGKGVYPGSTYIDGPRQGYNGANGGGILGGGGGASGGGGGGAGGAASGAGGGDGITSSISGSSVTYATGGTGGGGNQYYYSSYASGVIGGGGVGAAGAWAGSGAAGTVIISYPNTYADAQSTTGSPTFTNTSGSKIYKWTSSGSITFL
jgi:hypothetical protein